jgi:anti-sigma factor ChrR (cupin superfamily)
VFVEATRDDWVEAGAPGVRVRPLFVDPIEKMVTMLVHMGPGSSYPPHHHSQAEECYVIAGDLQIGDRVLHAGDYQRAAAGSRHETQSTAAGCLLLIRSSREDEILSAT